MCYTHPLSLIVSTSFGRPWLYLAQAKPTNPTITGWHETNTTVTIGCITACTCSNCTQDECDRRSVGGERCEATAGHVRWIVPLHLTLPHPIQMNAQSIANVVLSVCADPSFSLAITFRWHQHVPPLADAAPVSLSSLHDRLVALEGTVHSLSSSLSRSPPPVTPRKNDRDRQNDARRFGESGYPSSGTEGEDTTTMGKQRAAVSPLCLPTPSHQPLPPTIEAILTGKPEYNRPSIVSPSQADRHSPSTSPTTPSLAARTSDAPPTQPRPLFFSPGLEAAATEMERRAMEL